ncbi:MAG: MgtC/SapB family protein [Methanobacteriota archaeon]
MAEPALLLDLLIALGVGGLVGIEREHRREETKVIAGIRTFPLIAAIGFLAAQLTLAFDSPLPISVAFLVIGAFAMGLFWARHQLGLTGLTTPSAVLVTFLAGVLIALDLRIEAVVVGVATTLLLLTKDRLHGFAGRLSDDEMMGALQFAVVAFILFPLAPDRPVDPWGLVNVRWALLIVVFVSSLSFASFLSLRQVGPRRGLAVSGFLGGLVNSEATSLSIANMSREAPRLVSAGAVGVLLATTTMFVRNLAIAAFADPSFEVARFMFPGTFLLLVVGLVVAWRRQHRVEGGTAGEITVGSPFAIPPALRFAALFAVLSAMAVLAERFLGETGVYATALGAFVSAGAVVASVSALVLTGSIDPVVAGETALLASVLGVANKFVVLRASNRELLANLRRPLGVLLAIGALSLVATSLWMRSLI